MKYLPLVWAALRRHTTESLLNFFILTVAFCLFTAMLALRAAYDHAIAVNRMDRLMVSARFCCAALRVSRRAEIERIPGVLGVGLLEGVFGSYQEPSKTVGVWTLDGGTIAAIPELRLTAQHWKQLQEVRDGLLFTRTEAVKWKVKPGDSFPIKTAYNRRADSAEAWPFVVLDIVDDPATRVDWMPNIYGNYDYLDEARTPNERGYGQFVVSISNPEDASPICRTIDSRYANSEAPTYCVPLQMDARNMVDSVINMRQMSLGVGAAGLFMILFLCANSTAESVRERTPEFAVLKTIGFDDGRVATLVLLEATLPVFAGAVVGGILAAAMSSLTLRLGEGSGLTLPAASISTGTMVLALCAALFIGTLSAVLPLRRLRTVQVAPVLADL